MFYNNPLLVQLKQKLHNRATRVEGIIKSTEKGFGFLEVDSSISYFIPPYQMKRVMNGDRIIAKVKLEKNREIVEPEKLVEPFLKKFIGSFQKKHNKFFIIPDYPYLKIPIICSFSKDIVFSFEDGDWVIAELVQHKLRGEPCFQAEIIDFVSKKNNAFLPWIVTLKRHNLEINAPSMNNSDIEFNYDLTRKDLTSLEFVTIDNSSTKDIDDAIYIKKTKKNNFLVMVAIADPTSYISEDSKLDKIAFKRSFTNYLPGFNIPMLPRKLAEDICSLHPNVKKPVLVCEMEVDSHGNILKKSIVFFLGWIMSKAKLEYESVSNWLEKEGSWVPQSNLIRNQLLWLKELCCTRIQWRKKNALMFKDRLEFRFHFSEEKKIQKIVLEKRTIAHRIVEEVMIMANICAATILAKKIGYGIFNTHKGFDKKYTEQILCILKKNNIYYSEQEINSFDGFCKIKRMLDSCSNDYIENRICRFHTFSEVKNVPLPHFALGLKKYATWTSPIRKYGDMINHRLLKSIFLKKIVKKPSDKVISLMSNRKRRYKTAERDVIEWLYFLFFYSNNDMNTIYNMEIVNLTRSGIRGKLLDNGAPVFLPISFLNISKYDVICNKEEGIMYYRGKEIHRVSNFLKVKVSEFNKSTRSILVKPVLEKR
ncbi:Exoribonuclease 2 [Buchnera aphidicola (Anoecia corni)]|uniref:Exoribonuclease II n=1 Tax=Buchnera aphidicola (Anoecia corni) TaxID=2994477 RepID=A0AAT9IGW8_9GAMM